MPGKEWIGKGTAPWIDAMPVQRARLFVREAFTNGDLPDLSREAVRAKGGRYWCVKPNLGRQSFKAISDAVGGFDHWIPQ